MAEVIARRRIEELGWAQIEVASAGVGAFDGSPASGGALRTADKNGLDLSDHASTLLTQAVVEVADLILTMSAGHLIRVIEMGAGDRAAMITGFAQGSEDGTASSGTASSGIPDPIGGPDSEYAHTFDVLDDLIAQALARLEPLVNP
jgi:protein-tyrosine phosphatase